MNVAVRVDVEPDLRDEAVQSLSPSLEHYG